MPPTVGILGTRSAREAQRVRDELRRRGARVLGAELDAFPALHRGTLDPAGSRVGPVDLAAAPVWLLRQLDVPRRLDPALRPADLARLPDDLEEPLADDRAVRCWVESLLRSLSDPRLTPTRLVNDLEATRLHARKPLMAARLQRAQIPVPESLATNDPAAAGRFVARCGGEAVVKAAAGGGTVRSARELPAGPRAGPLLFQRRIRGTSLRTYVVADRVVACAEVVHGDVVDWREDVRELRRRDCDPSLHDLLVRACRTLGMEYAGIDVELDGAGRPWVLDVNPAPLFAACERATGTDVAGPLAERLLALAEAAS